MAPGARFLPIRVPVYIPVVQRIVVGEYAPDAPLGHHRLSDVLEDVVHDQIVRAVVVIDPIACGGGVERAVKIAALHSVVGALVKLDMLMRAVDVTNIFDPIAITVGDHNPSHHRSR